MAQPSRVAETWNTSSVCFWLTLLVFELVHIWVHIAIYSCTRQLQILSVAADVTL